MRLTGPLSRQFDPASVPEAESTGEVDWSRFNANFERLLGTDWREVNRNADCSPGWRLMRLYLSFLQQRRNAILDFEGKLRVFSRLRLPPNPSIVHFGAEAGWEAALLQALHGDKGRVLLIDSDPVAYQRFTQSPGESGCAPPEEASCDGSTSFATQRGWSMPERISSG